MIVKAAVKVGDNLYTGRRHSECIHAAIIAGEDSPITQRMQGFVDDTGEFMLRKMARWHAVECGQLPDNETRRDKPLISEELW